MTKFKAILAAMALSMAVNATTSVQQIIEEEYQIQEDYGVSVYIYDGSYFEASDNRFSPNSIQFYDHRYDESFLVQGSYIKEMDYQNFKKLNIDLSCIGGRDRLHLPGYPSEPEINSNTKDCIETMTRLRILSRISIENELGIQESINLYAKELAVKTTEK
ncbi:MAG: hypothetical protein GY909_09265 [Oligoflexia bacterium]|nr:hypothetical protein [Oligoflexia bacterium]